MYIQKTISVAYIGTYNTSNWYQSYLYNNNISVQYTVGTYIINKCIVIYNVTTDLSCGIFSGNCTTAALRIVSFRSVDKTIR